MKHKDDTERKQKLREEVRTICQKHPVPDSFIG